MVEDMVPRCGPGDNRSTNQSRVELDVRIFLFLGTVVVRATLDSACLSNNATASVEGIIALLGRCAAQGSAVGFW